MLKKEIRAWRAFCRHAGDFKEQQFATLGYHGG
jgi:hypothetical protein